MRLALRFPRAGNRARALERTVFQQDDELLPLRSVLVCRVVVSPPIALIH
jgi:hypothetical protein